MSFDNFVTNYTMNLNEDYLGAYYSNSSMSQGDYTISFWCGDNEDDYDGVNYNSTQNVSFEIVYPTDSVEDLSQGCGNILSYWRNTYNYADNEFKEGEILLRIMKVKNRIKFKINNSYHHIGIVNLTNVTATINVSSKPQQKVFNISDEEKFDVNEDGYYDLLVRLDNITEEGAGIFIQGINEEIKSEDVDSNVFSEEIIERVVSTNDYLIRIVLSILIILISIFLIFIVLKKRK